MKRKIAIIGGGITGLTIAYKMAKSGDKVVVYEKSDSLGGLLGGFKINGTNLEKAYHHIFKTDKDIISLIKELKLGKNLEWHDSSIGLYYNKSLSPFETPIDLLKFRELNLLDKFRLGVVALYLQATKNWQKFEKVTAVEWMEKMCGKRAFEVIWLPLLKGKFHDKYKTVSMAWLWARIHTRANSKEKGDIKEKLGYMKNGFEEIVKKLEKEIKTNGGNIIMNTDIKKIDKSENGKLKVVIGNKEEEFDKVVACVPSNVLARLIDQKKYKDYIEKLNSIDYLGAITLIFSSKQSLSKYYWHNINDIKSPFLAFIQHTNLVDKSNYKNEEIYYLGTYIPHEHEFFKMDDNEIAKTFYTYLKKMFLDFDENQIKSQFVFKLKNAQHIADTKYASKIPGYVTPIDNLYLSNFSQIYPEDRGINYSVREAKKIIKMIKD
jgi:protoporphyrinogen oxidase